MDPARTPGREGIEWRSTPRTVTERNVPVQITLREGEEILARETADVFVEGTGRVREQAAERALLTLWPEFSHQLASSLVGRLRPRVEAEDLEAAASAYLLLKEFCRTGTGESCDLRIRSGALLEQRLKIVPLHAALR